MSSAIRETDLSSSDASLAKAMEIWSQGVLKEKDGSMSDAIRFYRQALKIHEGVERVYRKKLHDEWMLHKRLQGLSLGETAKQSAIVTGSKGKSIGEEGREETEEDLPPCWILEMLPDDILLEIVGHVLKASGESWVNLSLTCSKFNELCFHNSAPFKEFERLIYGKQVYDNELLTLNGENTVEQLKEILWGSDYERMLREFPYIKFEGVYISVVNCMRYGANEGGSFSLSNPVQMITYFRYYRFYEDGKVLRLCTTDEPSRVVRDFHRENNIRHSSLCDWKLFVDGETNYVTIRRVTPKYTFVEKLTIRNQGHKRHYRLKWISSTVEDMEGNLSHCSLKNEKPFFFSGVKFNKTLLINDTSSRT